MNNLTTTTKQQQQQPKLQLSHHRLSVVCHRHPGETVTGFCAPCLSERLAGLDPDADGAAIPILETGQSSKTNNNNNHSELSRSKSCSGNRRNGFTVVNAEPRRKSCDVRARNSLYSLFGIDDVGGEGGGNKGAAFMTNGVALKLGGGDDDDEIRVLESQLCRDLDEIGGGNEEWKSMKEHIDFECKSKKVSKGKKDLRNIAGSIWVAAASGFSKKLQKWKQKQKMRRNEEDMNGVNLNRMEQMDVRHWRETQSEVGDYGFGRRSCDTEPRFSVDAGRASVDFPPRYSLDEPARAYWDGYLIGRPSVHRPNQMLAVVEDDDDHIVEDNVVSVRHYGIDKSPGGTEQTRDYYGEGLTRRRRSLDRSSSNNRRSSSVEIDELRAISNARVSPATSELFHGAKVLMTKNELRMPSLSPLKTGREERIESSDSASNGASSILDDGNNKLQAKKLAGWRKAWTNWGLSYKQVEGKFKFALEEDEEELPKVADKITSRGTHVSSSSSSSVSGSFMKNATETKGLGNQRREQQLAMERNKSIRYSPSPNNHEHGLLRFYLTPLRSANGGKCAKSRLRNSHSVAKNFLRL